MYKKILATYKIPLLLSATLSIVLIALKVERNPISMSFIIIGSTLGTFVLDMDYLIYAYFLEPSAEFSRTLIGYIKHKDISNILSYTYHHKNDLEDKILNSSIFQIVLAGASLFVVASNALPFVKVFVLSIFLNSIYKLAEEYFENRTDLWFWAFKAKPNKQMLSIYVISLFAVFFYSLTIF